jgi:hypothetical protein
MAFHPQTNMCNGSILLLDTSGFLRDTISPSRVWHTVSHAKRHIVVPNSGIPTFNLCGMIVRQMRGRLPAARRWQRIVISVTTGE